MIESRHELEASFGRRVLPLARRWRSAADRALASAGLSNSAGWALLHIGRLGDDVRQSDLVAELDMQGASVVRVLDQLEAAQLVSRVADPADRRSNRLRLTEAGSTLAVRIEDALFALRRDLMEGISDEELAVAAAVMEKIDARTALLRERDL